MHACGATAELHDVVMMQPCAVHCVCTQHLWLCWQYLGARCHAAAVLHAAVESRWSWVLYLQVIGFDMGGTSTDVSRFAGSYEHVFESTTAGVTIQAPQLDINTVAAGGGSRLFYR